MLRPAKVSWAELGKHANDNDAWIALNGVVWDFSGFGSKHPGGEEIIKSHLGKDGSKVYNEIHSPGLVLRHLGEEKRIGEIEDADVQGETVIASSPHDRQFVDLPKLHSITSLLQFEHAAERALTDKAWNYISGATEDGITDQTNRECYRHIMFRPRVLKGVGRVDISTSFLGHRLACPILNAPTSSVRLTHPSGEMAIAKASQTCGVPPIIPSMSSFSVSEVVDALKPGHPFFFQLYVHRDRAETEQILDEVCRLAARAIIVTVDLPVISKRETVQRRRSVVDSESVSRDQDMAESRQRRSAPPPVNTVIDPDLNWNDVEWIMKRTGLPVLVKGIQRPEDAKRALETGCAGIYISNHGGRALDTAPPAILVLLEIQRTCPEVLRRMEVVVDGGIRRGSDVLKAICLGASVVCIGRPFLYALSYGEEGMVHAWQILKEELGIAMQLLGITSLDQAHSGFVNTKALDAFISTPKPFGGRPTSKL
ncbi:uncharacterized protein Z519_05386 [Cladophialophora bantiana CBS 173.52]|uniref:L-lactate dehydrogenase (Cytochrome) n=1 Tax=Cladophialophora bantiana (strain ATCC 10958 / CBS 173.52 / CDC B-1940 / NIH 8579) TaxID=1442370 RepID=A0A0D2HTA4_CLAB1|nr:uncharacterized protein Z519_05386 [Cladophialophora bantiana CBS 173.52]KIW94070.1 hypothetical protein Z519_05386 [Cladophialophora bantiana CBS 173.52]